MGRTRGKSGYLKEVELRQFCARNNANFLFMLTMTFAESITDKAEAGHRRKCVNDWLRRRGVESCGVWQRQLKRGAKEGNEGTWHTHEVINRYIDVNEFRAFVTKRGWGTFCNIEAVGSHHGYCNCRFRDSEDAVKYITRYYDPKRSGHVPKRYRLGIGLRKNSVGTTRFGWVNGVSRVWRAGCTALGHSPRYNDYKGQNDVWRTGCVVLGLDYVDVMHRLLGSNPPGPPLFSSS